MEKKMARENGASESERESLPDTELRPSSSECSCLKDFEIFLLLLNVVVQNILKYSVKSMQTVIFPSSYVSLPHNGSSLKIKNLQLFEISIYIQPIF